MTRLTFSFPHRLLALMCVPTSLLAAACGSGHAPAGAHPATGGSPTQTGGAPDATGGNGQGGMGGGSSVPNGGTTAPTGVMVSVPEERRAALTAFAADLAKDRPADADSFRARWQPRYLAALPYDPAQAVNLSLIQASPLKLVQNELNVLAQRGFALSPRQQFGTFFQGYAAIYASHLPLFVSADSVLHAVHRSYDKILMAIESGVLIGALDQLLVEMQKGLSAAQAAGWSAETVADVDEYLAVGRGLLGSAATAAPVAGGSAARIDALIKLATQGRGLSPVQLFGQDRDLDFSQFTLRGHYDTGGSNPALERYFRASMWLGRTDLPLLSYEKTGVKFHRRPFAAALLMADLASPAPASVPWTTLDQTLRAFVGESDNMAPPDVALLRAKAGAATSRDLLSRTDGQLAQAIVDGGVGIQRIASQILYVGPENEGMPLDRTFLLLGQRFIIDSQVLSNVVYDRVLGPSLRLMPSPLDVAFAALGNDRAVDLLSNELKTYGNYPAALHDARRLVDAHEPAFWQQSLYGGWLSALRALSPPADASSPATTKLPAVASTEAWARRLLQTQLASWAELRHDTLLYAKQSYTGVPACEFPDAYVEPMPAVWQALSTFGKRGAALAQSLGLAEKGLPSVASYFDSLASTTAMLKDMADRQIAGEPFTADQMTFINQAVELKTVSVVCTQVQRPAGWYPQLFFAPETASERDTLVADVHTQPGDEAGNIVGKVLHVGTGFPRLMVTTFETCSGPRAYAGVVSSYLEQVTTNFDRLNDQRWSSGLDSAPPPPIGWMTDLAPR